MLARNRALKLLSALIVALLSGGVAWAASDTIDGNPADAPSETTTTVSESTTTTVESTTTTAAEEPEIDEPETDEPEADEPDTEQPADDDECKPGWGHGDKNHCH